VIDPKLALGKDQLFVVSGPRNAKRPSRKCPDDPGCDSLQTGMEIAIQSTDELEQLRTRLRKMTDARLTSFGKAARSLCRDPKCPEVFKRHLEEAKTEWRHRHPKAQ